jgi:hypothetical protein
MELNREQKFLTEFNRIQQAIENGVTPVSNELRMAKTTLLELIPSLLIQSVLLIISTLIVSRLQMSELVAMVVLLVSNSTTSTLSFVILVMLKHRIRVRVLRKYGLEVSEKNIAVLESMEYQSV